MCGNETLRNIEDDLRAVSAGLAFMSVLTVMAAEIWQAMLTIWRAVRKASKVMQRP
jgi:hypothetical protein